MPARNVVKNYQINCFYHIYNRGYQKSKIFFISKDYSKFKWYLQRCIDPNLKMLPNGLINTHNISDKVDLIAYCLMPNHFHFLFKLNEKSGITEVLRSVLSSYSLYVNKRHERNGTLFHGKPRGCLIGNEAYLLHLTRYIHLNPLPFLEGDKLSDFPHSSYKKYIGVGSYFFYVCGERYAALVQICCKKIIYPFLVKGGSATFQ